MPVGKIPRTGGNDREASPEQRVPRIDNLDLAAVLTYRVVEGGIN